MYQAKVSDIIHIQNFRLAIPGRMVQCQRPSSDFLTNTHVISDLSSDLNRAPSFSNKVFLEGAPPVNV